MKYMKKKSLLKNKSILFVVSSPETFKLILRDQPVYFSHYFETVFTASSKDSVYKNLFLHCELNIKRQFSILSDLYAVVQLTLFLLKNKPTIIHSFTPKAGLISCIAGFIARVPIRIHTFTGLLFPTAKGWKRVLFKIIDRLIIFFSTHSVAESLGVKHDLENCISKKGNIYTIGHGNIVGVDVEHYRKSESILAEANMLRAAHKIPLSGFVFGFVGRLANDKGISELVASFKNLSGKNNWLLLVGSLDERDPINKELLEEINTHERILSLGFLDDIRPALASFDVVVLPSYREGFPNSLIQAHSMEIPLIASRINGCTQIVKHEKNGWLVPPGDVDSLTNFMNVAILKKSQLSDMGSLGREDVKRFYSQEYVREEVLKFYEQTIVKS